MGLLDKEWDVDYVPGVKLGLHIMQIICGFVIFILEIILFKSENAKINSNNGWTFGLCFLSVPAWIFLVMTPRFERTRRLAQPHAMAVVDVVFAIFWLSGFASQAAYNTANSCGKGCKVSKAIVGTAFFQIVFWAGTSFLSLYTVKYYQFNGSLPGYDKLGAGKPHENIDPDKAAFSMAPHDEESYARINVDDHDPDDHDTPYNADAYGSQSSRPMFDSETEYRPHSVSPAPPSETPFDGSYRAHGTPSPLNDPYSSGYGSAPDAAPQLYAPPATGPEYSDSPAHFPVANYDRTLH
ncbi:uncharacterized protein BCR38DRAFT_404264 [Pseudomassariella vexata]|uniref:MARVEL domain-containing protein n=1 Tax=Pseudomassariella vexata TaxID=1141098 RepID=A0A1Y2EIL3_9PEZI|nr:uncharacterized protein BCR38DRAFT_404264 [Pseudomassariella vexata]ORY71144.1 hypothetical protein BCR38DRAFT_404264 [Pseudomassariella vexata]